MEASVWNDEQFSSGVSVNNSGVSDVSATMRPRMESIDSMAAGVLSHLPFVVLLADKWGRVHHMNAAAQAMFGDNANHDVTCCEAICNQMTSILDEIPDCLAAHVLTANTCCGEARIDIPTSDGVVGAWVTVAPGPAGLALFHLRPGNLGDRRRRTATAFVSHPRIRIFALGRTRIEAAGRLIDEPWTRQRPGELLKLLACHLGTPQQAEQIADFLWPEPTEASLGTVRYMVHALRARLSTLPLAARDTEFVLSGCSGYELNPDITWVDVIEFDRLVAASRESERHGDEQNCLQQSERALCVYRGDLFEDERYPDWAEEPRRWLSGQLVNVLRTAVAGRLARNDLEIAAHHAVRLIGTEIYDEEAHRTCIEIYLRMGRGTEAARCFALLAERLRTDLHQTPGFGFDEVVAAVGNR